MNTGWVTENNTENNGRQGLNTVLTEMLSRLFHLERGKQFADQITARI
jgi:hypothetical protein